MMRDILDSMKIKQQLQLALKDKLDKNLLEKLPSGYAIIGDIAIFRGMSTELEPYKKIIGELIIDLDPKIKVVIEQKDTKSIYRKPLISHIAGEKRTKTIHKEFNTIFHIDVSQITFSPGNKEERGYLTKIVQNNEIICDMFACIGNLSLPIVVNNPNTMVYGIEANKRAFELLQKNIRENDVQGKYFALFGDNREKTPEEIADRVLMGCFEIDQLQLEKAFKAIKDCGWIHYHLKSERNNVDKIKEAFKKSIKNTTYKAEIKEVRKVKKLSPKYFHMCFDVYIKK